jgi:glyoxylase-like metal-dependent hydrolase (beta-lactamase superfamily II)
VARPPAIELAPGVYRIPTTPGDYVNVFAFVDDDGQVTLVDCGYATAPKRILAALRHIGSDPSQVTRVLLTHAHGDHVGGLARLRRVTTNARVAVHGLEAGNVRSGRPPEVERLTLFARLFKLLPGDTWTPSEVDEELTDGQLLDVAGGVRVVHTPGHTPGHVALLHEPTGVLLTGDSLFNWRGRMSLPSLTYCANAGLTRRSAYALGELEYEVIAFTHGPEIRDRAREQVRAYLRTQSLGPTR